MTERGTIHVNKDKKRHNAYRARVHLDNGKKIDVPPEYLIDLSHDKKACGIEREKGKIISIKIGNKELSKKDNKGRQSKPSHQKSSNDQSQNGQSNKNNYLVQNTKLPRDTISIIEPKNIENFSLLLNKAPFLDSDQKFKFFKTDRTEGVKLNIQPDYSKIDIPAISERYKLSIEKLNIKTEATVLKPEWRMIVGLGNESVYETSMTLHHIYGIPYIPGSAIKGVTRSYFIVEKWGREKNAEDNALKDQVFCDIFGCPKNSYYKESRQGKIFFFDAIPLILPKIEVDIMNPHYGPYYSDSKGDTPPADYHDPNPIPFLTVVNTEFQFFVGVKEKDNNIIEEGAFSGENTLSVASEWMKKALNEHGIGAKTAVGYGYMAGAN